MSHDDALPSGHRLSPYSIERVLGRGGFGVTYLAFEEGGGGQVAIKEYFPAECAARGADHAVIPRSRSHESDFQWGLERFRDEGFVLARLRHPNIVRVVGAFEAHGTRYLVMQFVAGETLAEHLRPAPLDEAAALALILPIIEGLEHVHAAGYLHRDIKPANIVIGADGAPVLLDFGAARRAFDDRTRSLTALYTPGFTPIEQYSREGGHGASTDIYALAAVLYRCLTGRTPPDAPGRVSGDGLVPLAEAAPQAPSPAMQDAVHAALAVHARDRPQTLAEWRRMLAASPAATSLSRAGNGWPRRRPAENRRGGQPAPAGLAYADDLAGQRRRLVEWVRGQLVGPADTGWFDRGAGPAAPDEVRGSPVERFPIGVLHPVDPGGSGATGVDPAEPEADPDGRGPNAGVLSPVGVDASAPLVDDEDDESRDGDGEGARGAAARPVGRRRYAPPSSVGVSFYVRGEARLRISASAASYRRVSDRGESGRYQRQTPDNDAVGAGRTPGSGGRLGDDRGAGPAPPPAGGQARALEDAAPGGARYRRTAIECGLLWPSGEGGTPSGVEREVRRGPYRGGDALTAAFSQAETAGWKTQLDVRRRPHGDGHILTVVFANRQREAAPGSDRAHRRLFEARLECELEAGELVEYPRVDPALLTEEEQEIELRHRERPVYAIGHGAAAEWSIAPGRPRIRTECMPAVEVPVVTQEIPDLDPDVLVMDDLAKLPVGTVLARLNAFVDGYGEWVGEQRALAEGFAGDEGKAAERICARMDAARERMRGGVARLRRDDEALAAFRLANRAMRDQMRQADGVRGKDAASSGRPLDDPVDQVREGNDVRRYRWRPFQLAFLLAVIESTMDETDPCRGVLDLIWFPTGGGKTEAYLGLFAFLAVWRRLRYGEDGGGVAVLMRYTLRLLTRQQFERAARIVCALELLRRRDEARLGVEPVSVGLWVGAAASPNTCKDAAAKVADMVEAGPAAARAHDLVLQACPWCGRRFSAPDSYRTGQTEFHFRCRNPACDFGDGEPLPCNVVDEALYERPPTLLVGTIDKFARLAWEERAAAFFGRGGWRPPELVIQDELHLIAGPLGSVAGLYEAAVETVLERRGARPKYVASTATIRMAREQVERLYGRETAVFPPPGLSADDSWFARNDPSKPGRLYVGHLAPGLDQQHCLAPLAATLLAAPPTLFADQRDAYALLDAWWTLVVYHGSLRGVGASHIAFGTDVRDFLRRLEAERRQAAREGREPDASDADRGRGEPVVAQLTSQSSPQENARTFDRLATPRGAADCLDAVLATNMISVGVDVDRLAVMVVNGQPFTTAEYIQASSRIGRADVPGLVFANYYRHQARSLSHYENFRPYHESFYRFVEPTSVTPFTYQVRKRALHAALVIALRHGSDEWRANDTAARFDQDHRVVRAVVEALKERCRRAAGEAGDETAAHLDRLVGEWRDEAERCRRERRGLQYRCRDKAQDSLLVSFDDAERGCWRTLHSMRNVEDTAVLQAERPARDGAAADGDG